MKSDYISFDIDVPIYNHQIVFFLGRYEDITKFTLKKFNTVIDESFLCSNGMTFNLRDVEVPGIIFIAIDTFDDYDVNTKIELLFHEITHASVFIMTNAGIPVNDKNDEVLAYLNGYIINEVFEKLSKFFNIKNMFSYIKKKKVSK